MPAHSAGSAARWSVPDVIVERGTRTCPPGGSSGHAIWSVAPSAQESVSRPETGASQQVCRLAARARLQPPLLHSGTPRTRTPRPRLVQAEQVTERPHGPSAAYPRTGGCPDLMEAIHRGRSTMAREPDSAGPGSLRTCQPVCRHGPDAVCIQRIGRDPSLPFDRFESPPRGAAPRSRHPDSTTGKFVQTQRSLHSVLLGRSELATGLERINRMLRYEIALSEVETRTGSSGL